MKRIVLNFLLFLLACPLPATAAGFQTLMVPDPGHPPIEVGIWYPSDAPVPAQPNTEVRQALAVDGPISGTGLPLIVISHGKGGWYGVHADTALALAEAGFVVAAVTHTGDNRDDETAPASRWMVDRPRHIQRVIDTLLQDWAGHARIDAGRVGFFGFSAGAYTGLVAIGGVPDLRRAAAFCTTDPDEPMCRMGMIDGLDKPEIAGRPATVWVHDGRIKAAVLAAAGLGFAFDGAQLATIHVPVQLWAASEDKNVPYASNTAPLRAALSRVEFHMVEGPGHFAFRPPCNPKLEATAPKIWAMACVDPAGFDRAAFHRSFNAAVVAFFRKTLIASDADGG
jgi:predicted dienelactone hydrolase